MKMRFVRGLRLRRGKIRADCGGGRVSALANKLEREDVAEALLETAQDTLEACRR